MVQDIYDVGQSIDDKKKTDKFWEWMQVVWKTQNRKETRETKMLSQLGIKSPVKVTQMQIWFDFHIARTRPEKINGKPAMFVSLWKALKPEQQFRHILLDSSGVPNTYLLQQKPQGYSVWGGCFHVPSISQDWDNRAHYLLVPQKQTKGVGSGW